jgi:hypothetical protein
MTRRVLRFAAIAIAVLAVADPSMTGQRRSRPVVAVVASSTEDAPLAAEVSRLLDGRFSTISGVGDFVSATVLVGATVPGEMTSVKTAMFAVLPRANPPTVRIARLGVPGTASSNARVAVDMQLQVIGAAGREVTVELRLDGATVSRTNVPVRNDTSLVEVRGSVIPELGVHRLRAVARLTNGSGADSADTVVDVRADRLPVLFYDARPSWTSTFVRRALEDDARFAVSHRMITSRGVSNSAGPSPSVLRDPASLQEYATIVVGAPELLSAPDVAGLESFMRVRGGRVVLLMDSRSTAPVDRISGGSTWRSAQLAAPSAITDSAGRRVLAGREFLWPGRLPLAATVHANSTAPDSTRRPILWSVPVGAGRLAISGADDSWVYRDDASGFDAYWTSFVAGLALSAPGPIDLSVSNSVLRPGEEVTAKVLVREALLSNRDVREARVRAMIVSDDDSVPVRLWPDPGPGAFATEFVAPRRSGSYRFVAVAGNRRVDVPIVVDPSATTLGAAEPDVVRAFASSRRGSAVGEVDLPGLSARIASAIQPVTRVETWYPMRSPWWIVPFALLLGAEWWWRRRRGLA